MSFIRYIPLLLSPSLMFADGSLVPTNVTVGQNLEASARVVLNGPATASNVPVTLVSHDPTRLLFSTRPDTCGSPSITLSVSVGARSTPEFYVQGLGSQGSVAYTASAPSYSSGDGTVTLVPSAIAVAGPYGIEKNSFRTTTRSHNSKISVYSVAMNSLPNGTPQPVAGGKSVKVSVASSDTTVGSVLTTPLTIPGGQISAIGEFQPAAAGRTSLTASAIEFPAPPGFGAVTAIVSMPGLGLTGNTFIGRDLQIEGVLALGAEAPEGGLNVTLTSKDPKRLLLAREATELGKESIAIPLPAGAGRATFYLQALGDSGSVDYVASAPGYLERTATIKLSPSGVVVVGPLTLPEGQLLRSAADGGPKQHGFISSVSENRVTRLNVDTVQLDPVSHRSADITIQELRAGLTLKVDLKTDNPTVGTVISPVIIAGASNYALSQFTALSPGQVVISVATPGNFTQSNNDSTLNVTVKP